MSAFMHVAMVQGHDTSLERLFDLNGITRAWRTLDRAHHGNSSTHKQIADGVRMVMTPYCPYKNHMLSQFEEVASFHCS